MVRAAIVEESGPVVVTEEGVEGITEAAEEDMGVVAAVMEVINTESAIVPTF